MKKDTVQVNFRLPQELKDRLEQSAKENGRSITSELIIRLDESLTNQTQFYDPTQDKLDKILAEIQAIKKATD